MVFGPDARNVQADYQLDSFELGPILLDKARLYRRRRGAGRGVRALFAFFRFTLTGKAIRACADNHLGAHVVGPRRASTSTRSPSASARACVAVAGCAHGAARRRHAAARPGYTLLAFVIVIVGGLGSMAGALLGGVLIGVSEALAGLFIAPSAKSMFSFGLLILVLLFGPQGLLGGARDTPRLSARRRALAALRWALALVVLVLLPLVADRYLLSVATLILYFAYTRPGVERDDGLRRPALARPCALRRRSAPTPAGALFFHFGIGPWAGLWLAIAAVRRGSARSSASSPSASASRACTSRC